MRLAAPLLLGVLGKRARDGGLNAASFTRLFEDERDGIENAAPPGVAGALGLAEPAAAESYEGEAVYEGVASNSPRVCTPRRNRRAECVGCGRRSSPSPPLRSSSGHARSIQYLPRSPTLQLRGPARPPARSRNSRPASCSFDFRTTTSSPFPPRARKRSSWRSSTIRHDRPTTRPGSCSIESTSRPIRPSSTLTRSAGEEHQRHPEGVPARGREDRRVHGQHGQRRRESASVALARGERPGIGRTQRSRRDARDGRRIRLEGSVHRTPPTTARRRIVAWRCW